MSTIIFKVKRSNSAHGSRFTVTRYGFEGSKSVPLRYEESAANKPLRAVIDALGADHPKNQGLDQWLRDMAEVHEGEKGESLVLVPSHAYDSVLTLWKQVRK